MEKNKMKKNIVNRRLIRKENYADLKQAVKDSSIWRTVVRDLS